MKKTKNKIMVAFIVILCMIFASSSSVYTDYRPAAELTKVEQGEIQDLNYRKSVINNMLQCAKIVKMDDKNMAILQKWADEEITKIEYQKNYITADNEGKTFLYLTQKGYSEAVACGIMGNIVKESRFDPDVSGFSGYGLCQWCGGRRTACKNYMTDQGYDSSLEGELSYILYELDNSFSSVRDKLKAVPNTAEGASQAASIFCQHYEIPASLSYQSRTRASAALDFWKEYVNN